MQAPSVEDQLKNVQVFCNKINKGKFFNNDFYQFFKIPFKFRSFDKTDTRKSNFNNFKASAISIEPNDEKMRKTIKSIGFKQQMRASSGEVLNWVDYRKEVSSIYSVYFQIFYEDYSKKSTNENFYVFTFRVQSVLFENLNYTIEKRYSEFVNLASKLKKDMTATPPALPSKTIMVNTDENLMQRARSLSEWILVVANEKFYHGLELFSFINLPRDKVNAHINYNPILNLKTKFQYEIRIEKSVDMTNEKLDDTFKLYFLSIKINDKELLNIVSAYTVKRRYREFNHLHKILKKKFKRYKRKLPDLPSKLNYEKFTEGRKYHLERFLNELVKYPDVLDCVYFRKFLQLNPMRFNELNLKSNIFED